MYRMQEKSIYIKIIEMAEFGLLLLSKKYKVAMKLYNSLKIKPPYTRYIEEVLLPIVK